MHAYTFTPEELDAFQAALWCTAAEGGCTQPPHPSWQRGYAAHMERVCSFLPRAGRKTIEQKRKQTEIDNPKK